MIRYLLPTFLLFFIGCDSSPSAPKNNPPIAQITTSTTTLITGEDLLLNASTSSDSDGDIIKYEWIENNQPFNDKNNTSWTAPSIDGNYTISLKVTDNDGASAEQSITIKVYPKRKIFLIGDSTVAVDNPPKVGWGLKFGAYMKNPNDYYNVAVGGASSRSYKLTDTIDWNKTKQLIQDTDTSEGAYLMVHLGLNDIAQTVEDAEDNSTKTTMPGRYNSYYYELKEYTDWAKANDIIPVLIVPVENMQKYMIDAPMEHVFKRDYGDYAQTVRQLANDEHVLLLDLEAKSYTVFNNYDPDKLIIDFSSGYDKSDDAIDRVHLNDNGANIVASWVKELACSSSDMILCAQFK